MSPSDASIQARSNQACPIAPRAVRAYDIRGAVGREITEAAAAAIGLAFATRIRRAGGTSVCVGRDGRLHSPMLEAALTAGLTAGGVTVHRLGQVATPYWQFAAAAVGADGGVMVTASHNPPGDNGFKFLAGGVPLHGRAVAEIAALAGGGPFLRGAGAVRPLDLTARYAERLVETALAGAVPGLMPNLTAAWDAGHGMAGVHLAEVTARLAPGHTLLFAEPDGRFPARPPDCAAPGALDRLAETVVAGGHAMGFGFDGDADRLAVLDEAGRPLGADAVTALLAQDALARAPGAAIVFDVKASARALALVAEAGGRPVLAPAGRAGIVAQMRAEAAPLAGEYSGHIFCADWGGIDDALFAAVRLLALVGRSGRPLSDLAAPLRRGRRTPEIRLAAPDAAASVARLAALLAEAGVGEADLRDGLRVTLPGGWWLARASNTEDCLVVRIEAEDDGTFRAIAEALARLLRRAGLAAAPETFLAVAE